MTAKLLQMHEGTAIFFSHASGKKIYEMTRCYKARFVVMRQISKFVLPDAHAKIFAICFGHAA